MNRGPSIPQHLEAEAAAIDAEAQSAVEFVRGAPALRRSNQPRQRSRA